MKPKKSFTVCITGGHLAPALAVIDVIRTEYPDWQIEFIGRTRQMEKGNGISEESRIMQKYHINFHVLETGRFRRIMDFQTLVSLSKIPGGFIQAYHLCQQVKPDVILSFGGYIGLPIALSGRLIGIPLIIHEQTAKPGIANKIAGFFANKIFLTFPQTVADFPAYKSIITGLPIRLTLFSQLKQPEDFRNIPFPFIYITGGTTGAQSLNQIIYKTVPKLTRKFAIVHQTGREWYQEARHVRQLMRSDKRNKYFIFPYLDTSSHAWLINHAFCLIGRSGANTVGEIAALGKNAIFIPLPWSSRNEQTANAKVLEQAGSAIIIPQSQATPETIIRSINDLTENIEIFRKNAALFQDKFPNDGVRKIVDALSYYNKQS
jgi:UDP-N-acetylglucosamine--N-acetylmuramyl-(pentapeptide) pyrophosphoryl-undecaprenol N-acetylglucosamine transferase